MNYRLGPYGFCSHPDVADENGVCGTFGLFDQAAALKWIKNNISSFGGDPERITLLGQSAGAMSVDVLLSSPLTRDIDVYKRQVKYISRPKIYRLQVRLRSEVPHIKYHSSLKRKRHAA